MESVTKAATNISNRLTKSDLELLIIDSTTDDDSTPAKNVQLAVAQRTTSGGDIETIMKTIYENLRAPDREWRKINKTLGLIHTLLLSGSHLIIAELKNSLHMLRGFESFSFRENGIIERGGPIRDKTRQINYLLSNSGILEEERGESSRPQERYVASPHDQHNSYEPRSESHNYPAPSNERVDQDYDKIFGNQSTAAEVRQRNTRNNAISKNPNSYPQRQEQKTPSNGNSWPAQNNQHQPSNDIFAPLPSRRSDQYQHRNVVNEVELIQDEEDSKQIQNDLIADSNFQGNHGHEPSFQKPNDIFQPIPTHFQKPQVANHNFPPIPAQGNPKKPIGDIFQPIHKPAPTKVQTNTFQPILQTTQKQGISPSKQQGSLFKDLNTKSPPSAPKSSWEQEISNLSLNGESPQMPIFQATPKIPEFPSVSITQNILTQPTVSSNIPDLFQPLPQSNNPQSSNVQPTYQQSPAKSSPHIKISHNLDTTSGVSISQLKLSPSLVQSQAPQTQQKTEKPKNLEDALLGLEDLSSSLSTSKEKEIKPARNLGYY